MCMHLPITEIFISNVINTVVPMSGKFYEKNENTYHIWLHISILCTLKNADRTVGVVTLSLYLVPSAKLFATMLVAE